MTVSPYLTVSTKQLEQVRLGVHVRANFFSGCGGNYSLDSVHYTIFTLTAEKRPIAVVILPLVHSHSCIWFVLLVSPQTNFLNSIIGSVYK